MKICPHRRERWTAEPDHSSKIVRALTEAILFSPTLFRPSFSRALPFFLLSLVTRLQLRKVLFGANFDAKRYGFEFYVVSYDAGGLIGQRLDCPEIPLSRLEIRNQSGGTLAVEIPQTSGLFLQFGAE